MIEIKSKVPTIGAKAKAFDALPTLMMMQ